VAEAAKKIIAVRRAAKSGMKRAFGGSKIKGARTIGALGAFTSMRTPLLCVTGMVAIGLRS